MPPCRRVRFHSESLSRFVPSFVLVAIFLIPASARATAATSVTKPQSTWMPDVAERVASLRERTDRAAAEAKVRSSEDAQSGRWWRSTAVRPSTAGSR